MIGNTNDRRFFEPFGQRIAADGGPFTGGMGGVELGFTGHRHDTELGLIDMRGRVYDPLQKHFLTPDPTLGAPLSGQDFNQYAYAWNNPLSIVDPTGLQEAPAPGGIQIPIGLPTSVDQILQWLFPSAPKAPPPKPSPAPKGETTQKPATPTPATPKTDGQGSTGPTGPTSLPTPQEKPPAAAPQQEPRAVDESGFAPYNTQRRPAARPARAH